MRIIDLNPALEPLYLVCLEDWSTEIQEGSDRKEKWFRKNKERGLRVKLALDDDDQVGGMIQYIPVENSFVQGHDLYVVLCIWVHGHKEGRGDFRGRGMGKALLAAAEEDARALGAKELVAWGVILPFFIKSAWFKKQGYSRVDRQGIQELIWKPFADDAEAPRWITQRKAPVAAKGIVTVTAFVNGWCPAQNMVAARAERAAAQFGDRVVYREIDTANRDTFLEWGISDGLYVDGKAIRTGPPPTYERIHKIIAKRVRRL